MIQTGKLNIDYASIFHAPSPVGDVTLTAARELQDLLVHLAGTFGYTVKDLYLNAVGNSANSLFFSEMAGKNINPPAPDLDLYYQVVVQTADTEIHYLEVGESAQLLYDNRANPIAALCQILSDIAPGITEAQLVAAFVSSNATLAASLFADIATYVQPILKAAGGA